MEKDILVKYYIKENKSVSEIADILGRGETSVNYWMKKHLIEKRTISEAIYLKNNPQGDPFKIKKPNTLYLAELKGLGLGIYWGEGNKKNKNSIKLGNTDPELIRKFIEFLIKVLGIEKDRLKFSLQIFSDIDPEKAKIFWLRALSVKSDQFYNKITVTKSGKVGNYRQKSEHGVLTVYYHNTKLRNILVSMLPM